MQPNENPQLDELTVAELMSKDQLPSPYRFKDIYLVRMRVTGTGQSYRPELKEVVWRDPSSYLNDRFLKRASGIPITIGHPENLLNAEEFNKRTVGISVYPYIKGDEVWTIGRFYDPKIIEILMTTPLSTSPGVDVGEGFIYEIDNSENTLLIELEPSLVDHLAIAEHGVWDKGKDPDGIDITTIREDDMAIDETTLKNLFSDNLKPLIERMDAQSKSIEKMSIRLDAVENDETSKDKKWREEGREEVKHGETRPGKYGKHDREERDDKRWERDDRKEDEREDERVHGYDRRSRDDAEEWERDDRKKRDEARNPENGEFMASARKTLRALHDSDEEIDEEKLNDIIDELRRGFSENNSTHEDIERQLKKAREGHEEIERDIEGKRDSKRKDTDHDVTPEQERAIYAEKNDSREKGESRREREEIDEGRSEEMEDMKHHRERSDAINEARSFYDNTFAKIGFESRRPFGDESPRDYRIRMLKRLLPSTDETFQRADSRQLRNLDNSLFRNLERSIIDNATSNLMSRRRNAKGVLHTLIRRDEAGREIRSYEGDIRTAFAPFLSEAMRGKLLPPTARMQ